MLKPYHQLELKFEKANYRAFVFVVHETYGMLLLHCTKKVKKGPHYQLPGGHIDKEDLYCALNKFSYAYEPKIEEQNVMHTDNCFHDKRSVYVEYLKHQMCLVNACRIAAARELFEETGIDVRMALDRLKAKQLRPQQSETHKAEFAASGREVFDDNQLLCELKGRFFFSLDVCDDDFVDKTTWSERIDLCKCQPYDEKNASPHSMKVRLKLSDEHTGFTFARNTAHIKGLLEKHSGGICSKALSLSLENHDLISREDAPLYFRCGEEIKQSNT